MDPTGSPAGPPKVRKKGGRMELQKLSFLGGGGFFVLTTLGVPFSVKLVNKGDPSRGEQEVRE